MHEQEGAFDEIFADRHSGHWAKYFPVDDHSFSVCERSVPAGFRVLQNTRTIEEYRRCEIVVHDA